MIGPVTEADRGHLRRCIELAAEALEAGDEPFGSVLVDASGIVLREERNRVGDGDTLGHPEIALVRWASENLDATQRAGATVYTSGEHCPMCTAAHAWVGLGPIVYAASAMQLAKWTDDWQAPVGPVAALPIHSVAPHVIVRGPAPELEVEVRNLHAAYFDRDQSPD